MQSLAETIQIYIQNCEKKSKSTYRQLFVKAMFAGMFIGLGAAASNMAVHTISNAGVARLVAGVVFPVGLMMVILLGAELFTGDCLVVMALPDGKVHLKDVLKILVTVYIGNFAGAVLLTYVMLWANHYGYSAGLLGAYTIKVAASKTSLPFGGAICSGIICNILVCAAVLMAGTAKDVTGKLLVCLFVIMAFVTLGFEHCVANMYYITAGLLASQNAEYVRLAVENYGVKSIQTLTIGNFLVRNLLPVTIGNIIGGSFVIGLPLFFINKES